MRIRPLLALILPSAIAVAVACGGNPPAAPTTPSAPSVDTPAAPTAPTPPASAAPTDTAPATTASAAPATPPPDAKPNWKEMTKEQKADHMKKVVLPKMAEVLKGYDGKKWQDVKCTTCHGDGAKQGKFEMPNAKLPKLSFTDGFKKHMTKDPKITKFMMEKVVPEMATALGMQQYDPATKTGFGCAGCHIVGP